MRGTRGWIRSWWLAVAGAAALAGAHGAAAETVALIGTGNVGSALGRRFAEQGHTVVYGSRNLQAADVVALVRETGHGAVALPPAEAAARSRVVVLAVPWTAAEDVARSLGAIDVGPLRHARIVEGLHYLRANALGGRINYHFPRDTSRD